MVERKCLLSLLMREIRSIAVFEKFFRLFSVFALIIPVGGENNTCVKRDVCSCAGYRGVVDLHSLATSNNPKFSYREKHYMYYYNPCFNFSVGNHGNIKTNCTNVAACRYSLLNGTHEDLGHQNSADFGYNITKGHVFIKYSSGNTTTKVYLICSSVTGFDVQDPVNNQTFEFTLSTPCACPNGCIPTYYLSAGTVLCIIFLILVAAYFVVGVLYKKSVHGAVGIDVIPNVTFWTSLPGLIKDGYLFFISPCLGDRVEYKTYERL